MCAYISIDRGATGRFGLVFERNKSKPIKNSWFGSSFVIFSCKIQTKSKW